jgi:outer membrane immunogenic protein
LLAGAAIGALSVGSAGAADLPRRSVLKAAPPPPPPACAQFRGFYVGGQVGATYYKHRWHDLDGFGPSLNAALPATGSADDWGWNAGVTAGYNWQLGCTVFGVEGDWSWTHAKAERVYVSSTNTSEDVYVSSRMKWFGTLRGRLGGVVAQNLLLYVTGGAAWARFDRNFAYTGSTEVETFSDRDTRWGWTAGAGAEWAITSSVSVKGDVLYLGFPSKDTAFTSTIIDPGIVYRFDNKDSAWVSRIGVNFRF